MKICIAENSILTDDVDEQVNISNDIFIKFLDVRASTHSNKSCEMAIATVNERRLIKGNKNSNETLCQFNIDGQNTFLQQYKAAKTYVKTLLNETKAKYYHNQILDGQHLHGKL